jgi:hypothetical protein
MVFLLHQHGHRILSANTKISSEPPSWPWLLYLVVRRRADLIHAFLFDVDGKPSSIDRASRGTRLDA